MSLVKSKELKNIYQKCSAFIGFAIQECLFKTVRHKNKNKPALILQKYFCLSIKIF